MGRRYSESHRNIRELRGHRSWAKWHKGVLVQLDLMGLRHLLSTDLLPRTDAEHHLYASDQKRAVRLLIESMSEHALQRLWRCGWEMSGATLNNTLALLADLFAEPERYPQQSYGTHRDLVDLTRARLAPTSTNGFEGFLSDMQQCHLRLLARYGNGAATVEELLEHLFTSSVMEGLRAARPEEYVGWMSTLDKGRREPFVTELASLLRGPRADAMMGGREADDMLSGRSQPFD